MFNSEIVGNLHPFPKARQAFFASSQFICTGKSFCATNIFPIRIGIPTISLEL